jgi:hypothetical protein
MMRAVTPQSMQRTSLPGKILKPRERLLIVVSKFPLSFSTQVAVPFSAHTAHVTDVTNRSRFAIPVSWPTPGMIRSSSVSRFTLSCAEVFHALRIQLGPCTWRSKYLMRFIRLPWSWSDVPRMRGPWRHRGNTSVPGRSPVPIVHARFHATSRSAVRPLHVIEPASVSACSTAALSYAASALNDGLKTGKGGVSARQY